MGLVYLFRRSRFAFAAWCIFSLLLVYVLSSWWSWWYGGSFSSRHVIALQCPGVDLPWAADGLLVLHHLLPLGYPAG